jgi:hypothetical protein
VNRHKKGLAIVVPATTKTLMWTLSRDGVHMNKVVGTVDPPYQIDATKAEGNEGPKINAGPGQVVSFPQTATLTGIVTDDGLPKTSSTQIGDDGKPLNAGPRGVRFNWQVAYAFADDSAPLLPAGTILHHTSIFDNTAKNKRNPDPTKWVGFGQRSIDEMDNTHITAAFLTDEDYDRLVGERKATEARKKQTQDQQQQ